MNNKIMLEKSRATSPKNSNDFNPLAWKRSYSTRAILFSFLVFVLSGIIFREKMVTFEWVIASIVIILFYFLMLNYFLIPRRIVMHKRFIKKLFWMSVLLRSLFVAVLLFIFYQMSGNLFEPHSGDSSVYYEFGRHIAVTLSGDNFSNILVGFYKNPSDLGFPVFAGVLYYVFGYSPFVVFIANIILGSFSVILVYKIAEKLFGENVARTAGILMMIYPGLLFYTATHLKETTMLFVVIAAIYYIIEIRTGRKYITAIFFAIVLSFSTFYFRTVIGILMVATFVIYWFFYKSKRSKIFNFIFGVVVLFVFIKSTMSTKIYSEIESNFLSRDTQFSKTMDFRSKRDQGNVLALKGSIDIFLPLSIAAPYPSLVYVENQELLWFYIAAALIKNIFAFFAFLGIFYCVRYRFRDTTVILVPFLGYLFIIVSGGYAFSPRFQLPTTPFFLILTAVGFHRFKKKHVFWWFLYLIIILGIIIAWNSTKLIGRGIEF